MRHFAAIFCLCLFFIVPAYGGDVEYDVEADMACFSGYSNIDASDSIENVLEVCMKAAWSGAPGSQYFVGYVLLNSGQKENGIYWLRRSAENGHEAAQNILKDLQ